jgi:hypothetical protein
MAKIGPGYVLKDGKVVPVVNRRMPVSDRIRQRTSKKQRVVKRGSITHEPHGDRGERGQGRRHKGDQEG